MPGSIADNFLQGVQQGQAIGDRYYAAKNRREVQAEMQGLFEAQNKYMQFDEDAALPNAAAPATSAALPINEDPGLVRAAAENTNGALAPVLGPRDKPKKARTHASYEDLNDIYARQARIAAKSGDPKVLTALQDTFTGQVRGRALSYLADAQQSYESGNQDDAEKALIAMGKLFPSMSGMKFKRKDGELMFKSPLDGKEKPVDAEAMGLMYKVLSSPETMYDLIGQKRDKKTADEVKGRELGVSESNAATNATNAATNAAGEARLGKLVPSQIRQNDANALQSLSTARYQDFLRNSGATGANGGLKPDDARQFSAAVSALAQETLLTKDPNTDQVVPSGLPGYENATMEDVNRLAGISGQLAIANPEADFSAATQYGMAIDRYARGVPGAPGFNLNTKDGRVGLRDGNGQLIAVFRAPPQLMQMLLATANQRQQQANSTAEFRQGLGAPPAPRTNAQGIPTSIAR